MSAEFFMNGLPLMALGIIGFFMKRLVDQLDRLESKFDALVNRTTKVEIAIAALKGVSTNGFNI